MPYWKRADSPYFYGRVWDARARAWTPDRSLKVKDSRAADAACREWERRLADPAYAAAKAVTLEAALAGFGRYLTSQNVRGKLADATPAYHDDKIGPLLRAFGKDALISEITPALLEKYREVRHLEGSSEHNTTKELGTLRYALRIAKLNGQFQGDLTAIFPRMALEYSPRDRALSMEEVRSFLGVATRDMGAQIAFSVATSAEAKCLADAQRADVFDQGRFVLLRGTKRETRWRTVPVVTADQKWLLQFAIDNAQGDGDKLFEGGGWGLRTALRRIAELLKVRHVSPNDLRRTFAVLMREAGAPLELIAPLMGHKDTTMVQRVYGRLSAQSLSERLYVALNASAALNAGTACSKCGARSGAKIRTPTHSRIAKPPKREPTPGLEPGTYGLRNRVVSEEFIDFPRLYITREAAL